MTLEKQQLMQCIQDLANRAIEIKENNLAITLYVLYAAGMTGTDKELAVWNETFARIQLELMGDQTNTLDKFKTPDKL